MTDEAMTRDDASTTEERAAHGLIWGIKGSFLDYLRRMPDGRGAIGEGAQPVGDDQIYYSLASTPTIEDGRIEWTFRGDVRFSGHYGMLFVRVADPVLTGTTDDAVLTIAGEDGGRTPLVTLQLELERTHAGTQLWRGTKVELTQEGHEIFNEVYPVGEPFEPLSVQIPVEGSE